jgi:hypothetical protein
MPYSHEHVQAGDVGYQIGGKVMEIERLLMEFRDIAESYSVTRSTLVYLEEAKKAMIASQMKNAQMRGVQTAAAQEREALSSEDYKNLLVEIREAVKNKTKDEFNLRRIEMEIEVWRTNQANERLERKVYAA